MRKKIGTQQLIAYILLIAFAAPVLVFIFQKCKGDSSNSEAREIMEAHNRQQQNNKQTTATSFYKEGELDFLDTNGKLTKKISIEFAATEEKRSQGLMYRQSLGENEGMLFIFDKEEPQSFWMRNTYITLDLIYVNANKEIVNIAKMATPQSEAQILSEKPAQYVLEVNGGFCDRYQIKAGDKVQWITQTTQ